MALPVFLALWFSNPPGGGKMFSNAAAVNDSPGPVGFDNARTREDFVAGEHLEVTPLLSSFISGLWSPAQPMQTERTAAYVEALHQSIGVHDFGDSVRTCLAAADAFPICVRRAVVSVIVPDSGFRLWLVVAHTSAA